MTAAAIVPSANAADPAALADPLDPADPATGREQRRFRPDAVLEAFVRSITDEQRLDPLAERLRALGAKGAELLAPQHLRILRGEPLGHPLHPALTDLPIGFWTSAWVLDLCGRRMAPAATLLVGAGLATALPTAAAGLADWQHRTDGDAEGGNAEGATADRRLGVAHAAFNGAATVLYGVSFVHRLRGRRGLGVLVGMAAAGLATAAGHLGGELAYGSSSSSD